MKNLGQNIGADFQSPIPNHLFSVLSTTQPRLSWDWRCVSDSWNLSGMIFHVHAAFMTFRTSRLHRMAVWQCSDSGILCIRMTITPPFVRRTLGYETGRAHPGSSAATRVIGEYTRSKECSNAGARLPHWRVYVELPRSLDLGDCIHDDHLDCRAEVIPVQEIWDKSPISMVRTVRLQAETGLNEAIYTVRSPVTATHLNWSNSIWRVHPDGSRVYH